MGISHFYFFLFSPLVPPANPTLGNKEEKKKRAKASHEALRKKKESF
jgi:hypothetical protein